jgi:hypothetical protein
MVSGAIAVAGGWTMASPAGANNTCVALNCFVGGGVATLAFPNLTQQHFLSVTMSAHAVTLAGITTIVFQCEATATPDPASTGITQCSVDGISGIPVPNNLPGPYSTAVGILLTSGINHTACVSGNATFIEGILGPTTLSGGGCGPLNFFGS